jgi:transposase
MPKRKEGLGKKEIIELEEFIEVCDCGTDVKRMQAVLMLDKGVDEQMIISLTGINKSYAYKLRKRYEKKGVKGILTRKRKSRLRLTRSQLREVKSIITTSNPKIHGYESDFWTTAILADLIKKEYNVEYKSKKRLYLIFEETNFSYHKPDGQYKNRNQKVIDAWIEQYTPVVEKCIEDPNVVLLTEDEMILTTNTTFQKIWLPVGESPKIDISNNRKRRGIYGFLNAKTGQENAFKTEYVNSKETVKVLDEIGKVYPNKNIVILWDNAKWHNSKEVKGFLSTTTHKIHLIHLPPYAPELNPQEHVWKAGRANVTHNKFIENIDSATDGFVAYLNNSIFKYEIFSSAEL